MYFPVADIEVAPYVPPLVAFCISFFASMGGLSGAFLLLPFQVSGLGYTNPSVSATNQFYNIVAIPSGVWRFIREGRMVWPLAFALALGTLPGVFIGTYIRIAWLPDPKNFKLFAGGVLLYIGAKLLAGLRNELAEKAHAPQLKKADEDFRVEVQQANWQRIAYRFQGQEYSCPPFSLFCLTFVVGIIGGVYGIGGGAIIAPFLVSWYRLPIHTLSGATLLCTFLTSVAAVVFFILIAPWYPQQSVAPDWMLGVLFGIGGVAGMYLGARSQKRIPPLYIKAMLGVVLVGTAIKYFMEFAE